MIKPIERNTLTQGHKSVASISTHLMAQPPMDDLEEQLALLALLQHWQNSVAERLLQTIAPPTSSQRVVTAIILIQPAWQPAAATSTTAENTSLVGTSRLRQRQQ